MMDKERDNYLKFKEEEKFLNELFAKNDHDGLYKFIDDHDIMFFFKAKIDEKKLTIFNKLAFVDATNVFMNVIDKLAIKKPSSLEYSLKHLINLQDLDGNTAIHYASYRGNIDIIQELIKRGSDYSKKNNSGLTVMHMAAQGDRPNIIIYFKEKYHMDFLQKDFNGSTPLHWACHLGSEKVLTFILAWTDDINIQDTKGKTPLHIAVQAGRVKIIQKLIRKGANTYIKDSYDKNVYDIAANNKTLENIFRLLIDYKSSGFKFTLCKSVSGDDSSSSGNNYTALEVKQKEYGNVNLPKVHSNQSLFKNWIFTFLTLICESATLAVLAPYLENYVISITGILLCVTLVLSYFYMMNSNPGFIISTHNKTWLELVERKVDIKNFCPYCKVEKIQDNVKHCHSCGHCVSYFDHHCHWINNCIGDYNSDGFLFFLIVLISNIIYNFVIGLWAFLLNFSLSAELEITTPFINLFGFPVTGHIKDYLSLIVMSISLFFIIPVGYVMATQVNNRKTRAEKKNRSRSR